MPKTSITIQESALDQLKADCAKMQTSELRAALQESILATAEQLVRLAAIVAELERRGEDLSDLRLGILGHLRRIADGQVLPEVVAQLQGKPAALQRVSMLSLTDQRRIIKEESVEFVVRGPTGWDHRLVNPLHLDSSQFRQIIGPDGIRGVAEQIAYLEGRRPPKQETVVQLGRIRVDRERRGLVMGRTFYPVAQIVEALAELNGEVAVDEAVSDKILQIRLTLQEHDRIREAAFRGRTTLVHLGRRALIAFGLI